VNIPATANRTRAVRVPGACCRGGRVLASYLSRLRAFCGWAVALGIVDVDPTDALRRFLAAGMWPTAIDARTAVATQVATDGR
jgi:site-specific recombinase XerC